MSGDSGLAVIVGLGNPGAEYELTRHNAGFWFVEGLTVSDWLSDRKFQCLKAEVELGGRRVVLLKPQAFMNRSGAAVQAFCSYYKLGLGQVLVVHDELDLPVGRIQLKYAGGHGGHNGLRDIVARAGGGGFYRLRVGIGRPQDKAQVASYVLNAPSRLEKEIIEVCLSGARSYLPMMIEGQFEKVMSQLNRKVSS